MLDSFGVPIKRFLTPAGLAIALLAVALAGYALAKPKYAFDTITYLGCTFKALSGEDWASTQRLTYDHLRRVFPEANFREATESPPGISPYRSIVANDPDAFRQNVKVGCYKLGFVGPVVGLSVLGVDPYLATRLMAAIPAAAFFVLAGLWLTTRLPGPVAVPLAVAGAFAGLLQTARYEYPDGMTALMIGAALICFAEARLRAACALFLAAMVVRMDAILYFGAFLGFSVFLAGQGRRLRFREAVVWGVAALALYGAISTVMETPSFTNVFYHSFISQQPYLIEADLTVSLSQYFDVLERQVGVVAGKSAKYPVLIGLAVSAYALSFTVPRVRALGDLALVSLLLVAFHFLFIPWFDTRYYAAPYMLIVCGFGVVVFHCAADWYRNRQARRV